MARRPRARRNPAHATRLTGAPVPETLAECPDKEYVAEVLARQAAPDALIEDIDRVLDEIKDRVKRSQWESREDDNWWEDEFNIDNIAKYIAEHYAGFMPEEGRGAVEGDAQGTTLFPWGRLVNEVRGDLKRAYSRGDRAVIGRPHRSVFSTEHESGFRHQRGHVVLTDIYYESELYVPIYDDTDEGKVPADVVREALLEVVSEGGKGRGEWFDHDGSAWSITDAGDAVDVTANEAKLDEWVNDIRGSFFSALFDKDPELAKAAYMSQVPEHITPALFERLKKHEKEIPNEEWGDLCTALWGSDTEPEQLKLNVTTSLTDFLDLLETPSYAETDPHRIVGVIEWPMVGRVDQISENERSPWTVIRLTPGDLSLEGTRLRHCVGRPEMGYVRALSRGEIEVWSVRNVVNKPIFTIEVDVSINDARPKGFTLADFTEGRAACIKQVKGKTNRTPGRRGNQMDCAEVQRLVAFFLSIDVDPKFIDDMGDSIRACGNYYIDDETGEVMWPHATGEALRPDEWLPVPARALRGGYAAENPARPVGFDRPYRRLEGV